VQAQAHGAGAEVLRVNRNQLSRDQQPTGTLVCQNKFVQTKTQHDIDNFNQAKKRSIVLCFESRIMRCSSRAHRRAVYHLLTKVLR